MWDNLRIRKSPATNLAAHRKMDACARDAESRSRESFVRIGPDVDIRYR